MQAGNKNKIPAFRELKFCDFHTEYTSKDWGVAQEQSRVLA
jgi:hypothetical protein